MTDRKRIVTMVIAAICTAFIVLSVFFVAERNERFTLTEKSVVAMGTVVTEKIYGDSTGSAISDINSVINGLENTISWRKESSAVAILNEKGSVQNKYISEVVSDMKKLSLLTDGKFDLTVGKVSRLWNIGEENQRVPSEEEIRKALSTVGTDKIEVNGSALALSEGTQLDMGAIGKGFACDLIYAYLQNTEIDGAVVSVGGSIVAYGDYNKKGDVWRIAVTHPRDDKAYLGVITLDSGFVSTSGDYERYFEKDGKRYHHILDATTGYPSESGLISVTVVAKSGLLSDALSTACLLVGKDKAEKLLSEYGASAVLVDEELNITTVGEIEFEKQ